MGKDSQLHKALREYWKETKRKQRERDEEIEKRFKQESTGETLEQFKRKIKNKTTPF